MNIMMLLEMASSGFGERIAIGDRDSGLTYEQLFDAAGRAAGSFADAEIEHVGMVDLASSALPIALFGASWAGLPFVPMNFRLDAATLQGLASRVAPALAICDEPQLPIVEAVDGVHAISRTDFLAALPTHKRIEAEWSFDGDDPAILLFTSGTTGEPKAAVLRQTHLVSYIFGSVEFMGAAPDEATLISVPPYHVAGVAAILSSVYAGRRIVQLPQFDADTWIDTAVEQGVTHAMVVPTMLSRIVDCLDRRGDTIPTLRAISYGGGKMAQPVIERALELLPSTNFVNAYGLTETSSTIALLGPDDHREAFASTDPAVRRRLSSAGRPLPSIELTIRDEAGESVAAGIPGEVWVRGEQVSGEYVGLGSRLDAEGWFPTNDGGWLDADGYLFISGRIDDVIIRGGENISPGEIEDVLLGHPAIAEVACVGVADEQWGEVVAAAIVCVGGTEIAEDDLRDLVRSALRSSKVPAHFTFVEELPYSETGKLLRRVLRSDLTHLGDRN